MSKESCLILIVYSLGHKQDFLDILSINIFNYYYVDYYERLFSIEEMSLSRIAMPCCIFIFYELD